MICTFKANKYLVITQYSITSLGKKCVDKIREISKVPMHKGIGDPKVDAILFYI